MPWMMQMLGCAATLLIVAFVMWVGFWVFLWLMLLGAFIASWSRIRRYLVQKGILNPVAGVPPEAGEEPSKPLPPVIEGDYTRVDSDE